MEKKTLPARYPREQATIIFQDLYELDHVNELLDEMCRAAVVLEKPETTWDGNQDELWRNLTADPLTFLIRKLREAFIEYERFWEPEGWTLDDDPDLRVALEDHAEMWWRLNDLREGCWRMPRNPQGNTKGEALKVYDPALLACGEALYLALTIQQSPGDKKWIIECVAQLKAHLLRYHTASLEVLLGRQASFTSGRTRGSLSPIHRHFRRLYQKLCSQQREPDNFEAFWSVIEKECQNPTVKTPSIQLHEIDGDKLNYRIGKEDKSISKATLRNKFRYYKDGIGGTYKQKQSSKLNQR
ncbi:hypothetical protein SAMN05216403_102104 [Nitrosospira multiformis ATCC 25196]|uniref:Uncharacterized protein n=2 Tax=Nitrosospira multiformis TaxID=1231 RepID=Q2YAI5_NITMU|nr:hypothetical protein [Nitrosospira multiformis]ABB74236.1 hypothetical protein Nmul_A0933 [Nitrosospira multiformis ATCC 25196]SEF48334.1 hypothetical protein SAMN05216403_102104 [Nitrosospira multiformis ATCC 25196]